MKVFVSHATRDNPVAQRICQHLTQAGIRCWLDNFEIEPTADWLRQAAAAVRASSHGLFLLSPSAIKSPAAMREYRDMLALDKPTYVAMIEAVPTEDLPYNLQTAHTYDLVTDMEAGLDELVRDMAANEGMVQTAPDGEEDRRDITITLQANLTDLDTERFVDLIARLVDVGITDIKVVNVAAG
jgi:hypothetical protein